MDKSYEILGTYTPDNLFSSHEITVLTKGITLAKGQGVIKRGTVVGIVTATGLAKPVNNSMVDGSQIPFGITTDTIDTGDGTATVDSVTTAYITGLFNSAALTFGGDDTIADHETKLRELGIFVKENIAY